MRFFIIFAAIALCVNGRFLSRNPREAPYPALGPISHYEDSHVPFAAYGLPPQQIVSIIPSVQRETIVAPTLPASVPLSEIPSPILVQTPEIPAENPIVPQQQAFFAVPPAPEALPLPKIPAPIFNAQPIQSDVLQQSIVSVEVPHVPAESYGPAIIANETPRFEVHNNQLFIAPPPQVAAVYGPPIVPTEAQRIESTTEQLVIPPAPQPLSLPEISVPIFSETPREPFAAYGIPTLREEPKTEAPIPAAVYGPPIVSTEAPKIEASTQPLVIPPAPEALPLPEIPQIIVSQEPARIPFEAYGIPTFREEPKTEAPIIPAAIYGPPIVSTEEPRIESTTQPLVIPPAPEALPLPELPIPVFVEPPRQPFSAYGAPLFHEEPKTEAPIVSTTVYEAPIASTETPRIEVHNQQIFIAPAPQAEEPAVVYAAPVAESGPYPAKGPVSHYEDTIISSSPAVLNEPIVESVAISGGPYPAKGPISHYGDAIVPSSPIVLSEPIVTFSAVSSGPYPAKGPVSHYGDAVIPLTH